MLCYFKWVKYEAENIEISFIKTFYSILHLTTSTDIEKYICLLTCLSVCLSVCLHPINERSSNDKSYYVCHHVNINLYVGGILEDTRGFWRRGGHRGKHSLIALQSRGGQTPALSFIFLAEMNNSALFPPTQTRQVFFVSVRPQTATALFNSREQLSHESSALLVRTEWSRVHSGNGRPR